MKANRYPLCNKKNFAEIMKNEWKINRFLLKVELFYSLTQSVFRRDNFNRGHLTKVKKRTILDLHRLCRRIL